MEHQSSIHELIVVLTAAVVAASVFHRLRVPTIVSYLMVGILLGPQGLAWVHQVSLFQMIAEFGVAFLLFTLGLEFSLPRLWALKRVVLGLGGLQVLICLSIFGGLIYLSRLVYDISLVGLFISAAAITLSSTAIVSKELTQRNEINTTHGQNAIGILLFQDIAAIVILVLISASATDNQNLLTALLHTGGNALLFFVALVVIGKWILPPVFTEISKTRSEELFVLAVLVVALVAAAVAHELGLAMALGAFMAGMMLGESHFRHQIELEIKPFRDVLLGIFFVSVGLAIDVETIATYWPRIIFFTGCLIVFKTLLIALLCKLFGNDHALALRTGLVLCQGGEFGFALLALSVKGQLVPQDVASFFLAIIVLSMAITPFLMSKSQTITQLLLAKRQHPPDSSSNPEETAERPVLLCGYGRVGQTISYFLSEEKIPFVAVDNDANQVKRAQLSGESVFFGNAKNIKHLLRLGLGSCRLVILSFTDVATAKSILKSIRQYNKHVPVLVRTQDDKDLKELIDLGATEVIPETLESSLMLVSHVMLTLDLPTQDVEKRMRQIRHERYRLLRAFNLNSFHD